MQSENTAGVEQETIEDTAPGIETLGELMQDEVPADDVGASEDGESGSEEKPLQKFNDLAGRLGVELEELYKLEVSQAEDGTAVTIENLKDFHAGQSDFDLRVIEFEERKTQQEAEMMQAQTELRALLDALPEKAVRPEVLQKIRAKNDAQRQLENRRTLDVIPEWNDADNRTKDIEQMAEHLTQYGYPVNFLETVGDHRMMKYIRDNMRREQRIRQALAKVSSGKPNPTPAAKPNKKAPQKNPLAGVKVGNARNKLEAIFSEIE